MSKLYINDDLRNWINKEDPFPVNWGLSIFGYSLILMMLILPTYLMFKNQRNVNLQEFQQPLLIEHKRLDGPHKLQKIFSITNILNQQDENKTGRIYFAWKDNTDHAYVISSIPFNNVRIQIDDSISQPIVYFHWHGLPDDGPFNSLTIPDTSAAAFKGVDEVTFVYTSKDQFQEFYSSLINKTSN